MHFSWDKNDKFSKYLNACCSQRFSNSTKHPLTSTERPQFPPARMTAFSKQELSSRPWGNGGPYPNVRPWEKDFFWGLDTLPQFKRNFCSSRGMMDLKHWALHCVPQCLVLLYVLVPLIYSPKERFWCFALLPLYNTILISL